MGQIEILIGKTITCVDVEKNPDRIKFSTSDGKLYCMDHSQDCCESVDIEDICGEWEDLIGTPILRAEERTKEGSCGYDSETWTFYELATNKGSVTIRWYGTSNGYYSESVDFYEVKA